MPDGEAPLDSAASPLVSPGFCAAAVYIIGVAELFGEVRTARDGNFAAHT